MSTSSARGDGHARAPGDTRTLRTLPNELLLAIWDELPPLERVCLSQVCLSLRKLALATPSIWTSVALVVTDASAATSNGVHTVYHPRPHSDNLDLSKTILARSNSLPLDLAVSLPQVDSLPQPLHSLLEANRLRLASLHFTKGPPGAFNQLLECCSSFPTLRVLTAGFDNGAASYPEKQRRPPCAASPALPCLSQIHLGVEGSSFISWERVSLPGVQRLTVTPRWQEDLLDALTACVNVDHLTVILSMYRLRPMPWTHLPPQPQFVDALVRIPQLYLADMPVTTMRESFILRLTNDARFRDLRLEYTAERDVHSQWRGSFPSPCDALEDPVRLSVRLRAGAHEIDVVDSAGRRREILMRHEPLPLWDAFLRERTVTAAEVDTRAWAYFAADRTSIPIAELTLVIAQDAAELDSVSLGALPALSTLRIAVLHGGIYFGRGVFERLVGSRPPDSVHPVLPVLALAPTAVFEDENALAALATILER